MVVHTGIGPDVARTEKPARPDNRALVAKSKRADLFFAASGIFILVTSMAVLAALILDLAITGLPRIDWEFLVNFPSRRPAASGILSAWVGTTLVMIVTAALAIPLGVAAGLYLEEYARKNWLTHIIEIAVINLAGVPSIVYGLLALGLFVYGLGLGRSILVAGMVLALLILPVIIVATREAVRAIPQGIREASYALGANRWQTMWMYIIPAARPGILTGIIVGLARAIGETAPVITIGALTFIAFLPPAPVQPDFPFFNFDWLTSPFTLMPIQMFNWISRPQPAFHVNAAAVGVVLLFMTFLMNAFAIWLRYRVRRMMK
jgi:phosphate transport system permease protein